ncbi:MAG: glutamine-hydrolyzing GMP synthase [Bacteroidales bacterium]|nr:glutamine-hydrolyzing GMP synthase [Bacteroidales bacterium]
MDAILILDFGSQYTQLIARIVREHRVYCEIFPWNVDYDEFRSRYNIKGIILSGSPYSVNDSEAPIIRLESLIPSVPILGICYGAQMMAYLLGGKIKASEKREYGRARLATFSYDHPLFDGIEPGTQVWMSHSDTIVELPPEARLLSSTESIRVAAYEVPSRRIYGVQFHPEVYHTSQGKTFIHNFLNICQCKRDWTPASFIEDAIQKIRQQTNGKHAVMALSGGVDSSVVAALVTRAIGDRLHSIFVNNGLLRKNEFDSVLNTYHSLGINVKGVDACHEFLSALHGITDPEQKRKIIGRIFYEVFEREAKQLKDVDFLVQGTIYPDVIESVSVAGPSQTIKSHHNVGGLPSRINLKLIEPVRYLFKDEVRKVGKELGLPDGILNRHPFPGPGLAIRIIGEVTKERIELLQEADAIFIDELKKEELYDQVWQAFAVLLPVQTVGVMGDERTYESVIALRAVTSRDGMTADWARLPNEFLARVSTRIVNEIKGINRVVYDITSKPPSTIEWE